MNDQGIPKKTACSRLVAFGALALIATNTFAMSGTSQVAWRDKPVPVQPDWPAGVLDLVNDPLRTEGWNPWFSEWPNDVNYYAFKVSGTNDVNRLTAKLAAIKGAKPQILLNPGKEARVLAFTTVLDLFFLPLLSLLSSASPALPHLTLTHTHLSFTFLLRCLHQTKSAKPEPKQPEPTSK